MDSIGRLKKYLTDFVAGLRSAQDEVSLSGLWISREDEGSLFLDRDEQAAFRVMIKDLYGRFGKDGKLSVRAIERALQNALFTVADNRGTRGGEAAERIKTAMRDLQEALTEPPRRYDWWVPIRGIDHDGLPFTFAGQVIQPLDETVAEQVRALRAERVQRDEGADDQNLRMVLSLAMGSPAWRAETVHVSVEARDGDAAQEAAWRQARQLVDVLNFFSDLLPYQHGRAYLPAWGGSELAIELSLEEDGSISAPMEHKGPIAQYSLSRLSTFPPLANALTSVEALVSQRDDRSDFQEVLLAAVEWAGRATTARGREEGFLLFAIALESLFLADGDPRELGYRLALRLACFMEESRAERARLVREVRRLYEIRSTIVHSGSYDASDEEFHSMRHLAKRAILRALVTRALVCCDSRKAAGEWFELMILS